MGVKAKEIKSIKVVQSKEESPEETQKKLNHHFEQLVANAKKEGKETVQFLATDLFIKATDSSLNGDPYSAAFLFKYALSLIPDDLHIQKKYGVELIKVGKVEEALQVAKNVVTKTSYKDESYALILAGIYTAVGNIKAARITYKKMIKIHPKSVEACSFLGKSFIETKEYKKAKTHFKKCAKRIKKTGVFSYYLGKIALLENKEKKAIRLFAHALKISPEMEDAILGIGELYEKKEQSNFDLKAIKLYRKFLKENPENFNVLTHLVELMFKNEMYQDVMNYAEVLAQLDPSNLNLQVRLGIVYTDFKKYEMAKQVFKEILKVLPDSDKVLYYLASLYQQTGHMDLSVEYFSKIKKSSNLYRDSSLQIAQNLRYMAQKDHENYSDKFVHFAEKKLKELPELKVDITVFLVGHFDERGDVKRAITKMEDIKSDKKFTDDHSYLLASLFEKINDYESSEKIINGILVKNPDDPNALNFLGYSLIERGENLDKAYTLLSKAIKIKPEDGYIHDSLGWYFYKVGKYKKALDLLEKAYSFVKTDAVIARHLAQVYSQLKFYDKAHRFYLIALEHAPAESEALMITKEIENLEKRRLPASENKK